MLGDQTEHGHPPKSICVLNPITFCFVPHQQQYHTHEPEKQGRLKDANSSTHHATHTRTRMQAPPPGERANWTRIAATAQPEKQHAMRKEAWAKALQIESQTKERQSESQAPGPPPGSQAASSTKQQTHTKCNFLI